MRTDKTNEQGSDIEEHHGNQSVVIPFILNTYRSFPAVSTELNVCFISAKLARSAAFVPNTIYSMIYYISMPFTKFD